MILHFCLSTIHFFLSSVIWAEFQVQCRDFLNNFDVSNPLVLLGSILCGTLIIIGMVSPVPYGNSLFCIFVFNLAVLIALVFVSVAMCVWTSFETAVLFFDCLALVWVIIMLSQQLQCVLRRDRLEDRSPSQQKYWCREGFCLFGGRSKRMRTKCSHMKSEVPVNTNNTQESNSWQVELSILLEVCFPFLVGGVWSGLLSAVETFIFLYFPLSNKYSMLGMLG